MQGFRALRAKRVKCCTVGFPLPLTKNEVTPLSELQTSFRFRKSQRPENFKAAFWGCLVPPASALVPWRAGRCLEAVRVVSLEISRVLPRAKRSWLISWLQWKRSIVGQNVFFWRAHLRNH